LEKSKLGHQRIRPYVHANWQLHVLNRQQDKRREKVWMDVAGFELAHGVSNT
jgi:hypothetical protein